jgi:hypothetical protein
MQQNYAPNLDGPTLTVVVPPGTSAPVLWCDEPSRRAKAAAFGAALPGIRRIFRTALAFAGDPQERRASPKR